MSVKKQKTYWEHVFCKGREKKETITLRTVVHVSRQKWHSGLHRHTLDRVLDRSSSNLSIPSLGAQITDSASQALDIHQKYLSFSKISPKLWLGVVLTKLLLVCF